MSWACNQALTANILESYQVAGPLFAQSVQSFLAAQCALVGDHLWPDDATEQVFDDPNYDFIVVGAGSAGAVVANRLSENPQWKVLLVEAGGNPTLGVQIPQLFFNLFGTSVDWAYRSQPQEGACRGYKDKGCAWPRGKTLGGSSSTNGMYYVRGNKADFDQWAADGNKGWSYDDVLPYFIKSEKFSSQNIEKNKFHSGKGKLHVQLGNNPHSLENMLIEASGEIGVKNNSDINGADQMGIIVSQTNIKENYRFSTARAFLTTATNRKNLHVMKNAYVTQILFASGTDRVNGVLISKDGIDIIVNAKKEVIVSAGAVNSPQLLMLSGLGPKKHLEEMGIQVRADLPVGENLQDHPFTPILYTKSSDDSTTLPNIFEYFTKYIMNATGPLVDTRPHRVISFINTIDPTSSIPDIQFHYVFMPPQLANMIDIYGNHGYNDEIHSKILKLNENKIVLNVFPVLLHPLSSGKILLASKDPNARPLIYPNYFKEEEDIACIVRGMKHALKLGHTETFKKEGFTLEWLDLDACKELVKGSDKHLECIARELTFSLYHPTSTVKMGPLSDPMSVVDPELRVRKVKGLRVIDASVMPFIVRGNTNAATIMIGEKGADLIKKSWSNGKHHEL